MKKMLFGSLAVLMLLLAHACAAPAPQVLEFDKPLVRQRADPWIHRAEDGKTDIMVYHARDYKEIEGASLNDPNRDTRLRVLHWDENGFPDFRQELGD